MTGSDYNLGCFGLLTIMCLLGATESAIIREKCINSLSDRVGSGEVGQRDSKKMGWAEWTQEY